MNTQPPSLRRSVPFVLAIALLAAVVLLSGCAGVFPSDSSLPDGETAATAYQSLDGYTATVQIEQNSGPNRTLQLVADVDGTQNRVEYLDPPALAGNVVVYNGSSLVRYNATRNEYAVVSMSGQQPYERAAGQLRDVVESARASGETTANPGVSSAPLPVVPAADTAAANASGPFAVSYEGKETVRGREAYVIRYEAAGDRDRGVLNQTIWMDAEYFVTLKSTQYARFGESPSAYSFQMTNVTFDPDIDPDRFVFDPPEGATLNRSLSYETTVYESRSALATAAPMRVPAPPLPPGYDLDIASLVEGINGTAVELQYRDGTSTIILSKSTAVDEVDLSTGKSVTVGDQPGRYRSSGTQAVVVWRCADHAYVAIGTVQQSTLLDVARSVECG